jgi:transmembrane 9 superfamily protein 2/4
VKKKEGGSTVTSEEEEEEGIAHMVSSCRPVAVLAAFVVLALFSTCGDAFYLPGVAPQEFSQGDIIHPRVGRVSSAKTHIPFDYYDLPLCPPVGKAKDAPANLGEILTGDRYHDAPFELVALQNETCKEICQLGQSAEAFKLLRALIVDGYDVRMRIDNMPFMYLESRPSKHGVSLGDEVTLEVPKEIGYPLGSVRNIDGTSKLVLNNHITLWIMYHNLDQDQKAGGEGGAGNKKSRIIAAYVTSSSYNSDDNWEEGCGQVTNPVSQPSVEPQQLQGRIRLTYSVKWVETGNKWATRWDSLLEMDSYEHETNWSSIVNSVLLSLLLGFLVAIILLRSVKNDFAALRELEGDDELDYDTSNVAWKKMARDVFRPPRYLFLLSVLYGNGKQLLAMIATQMVFALLGFYSPSNRGSFITYSMIGYACMAVVGGRSSSKLYGSFPDELSRRHLVLATALLVPGVVFASFFTINLALWILGSSGAIPFFTLVYIAFLWFGITLPLTFVGSYFGYKVPIDWPIRPSKIPRIVPQKSCFLSLPTLACFGGITLYSMTFIQVFSIVQKVWLHQFVYMFGFLFLSGVCFVIGCIEVAIITIYLTLSNEDYKWWWRGFLVPASSGVFMFFGTVIYQSILTKELFENVQFVTMWMMTSYLAMACLAVSLIAGSIGLSASIWFTNLIYSRCKPE